MTRNLRGNLNVAFRGAGGGGDGDKTPTAPSALTAIAVSSSQINLSGRACYYMLFIVDTNGVPSVASLVRF